MTSDDIKYFLIQDNRTGEFLGYRGGRYLDEKPLTLEQVNKFKKAHANNLDDYDFIETM